MDAEVLKARRRRFAAAMPDIAVIRREKPVGNRAGGTIGIPAEAEAVTLRARATPLRRPRTEIIGGKPTTIADWEVAIGDEAGEKEPAMLDVLPNDVVRIGQFEFRVVDTDAARSDALCLTITALRVS